VLYSKDSKLLNPAALVIRRGFLGGGVRGGGGGEPSCEAHRWILSKSNNQSISNPYYA